MGAVITAALHTAFHNNDNHYKIKLIKQVLLVATTLDTLTGREKLELLDAASTRTFATALFSGTELAFLNVSSASTTTEPSLREKIVLL